MLRKVTHHNVSIVLCFLLSISSVKANSSALSQADSLENDNKNIYQAAFDILEKSLNIMGFNKSDNIPGSDVNWDGENISQLSAIANFFKNNNSEFLLFNSRDLTPKTTADEWSMLVSDSMLDSQADVGVTWGLNVAPTFFGTIEHKHNFNASAVNDLALRVSVCIKFVF
tara:strand:+ start:1169 stop:1678 length:510 start_codon:yes stop_codon:yes gene_type:complete